MKKHETALKREVSEMPSARAQRITSRSHCPSNTGHHPRYPLSTRVPMDIDTQPGVQTSMGSKTQMDGVKLGSHSTSGQRATGAADAAPGCVGGSSFLPLPRLSLICLFNSFRAEPYSSSMLQLKCHLLKEETNWLG